MARNMATMLGRWVVELDPCLGYVSGKVSWIDSDGLAVFEVGSMKGHSTFAAAIHRADQQATLESFGDLVGVYSGELEPGDEVLVNTFGDSEDSVRSLIKDLSAGWSVEYLADVIGADVETVRRFQQVCLANRAMREKVVAQ